jgi:hypothetical protein
MGALFAASTSPVSKSADRAERGSALGENAADQKASSSRSDSALSRLLVDPVLADEQREEIDADGDDPRQSAP